MSSLNGEIILMVVFSSLLPSVYKDLQPENISIELFKYQKMILFLIIILVVSPTVFCRTSEMLKVFEENCEVSVHFMHLCYFFDYNNVCFPWKLDNCNILHYSANEPNCIVINCPVSYSDFKKLQILQNEKNAQYLE